MELIVIAVVIILVLGALGAFGHSSSPTKRQQAASGATREQAAPRGLSKQRVIEANRDWLQQRWQMAEAEEKSGNLKHFPKWYSDEATDKQRSRLKEDGVSLTPGASKGQHADVIGLFIDPEPEALEKLKFFDISLKGEAMNQTRARHELAVLEADPGKQAAWNARPADAVQKEFYRFIGEKPPARLTSLQAETKMAEALSTMSEAQQDEWSTFESLIEEFDDREFRSDLEIRKPTPADIRYAMAALKEAGKEPDDPYAIAEKLLELKPSLARA